jgi:hypothetical protein
MDGQAVHWSLGILDFQDNISLTNKPVANLATALGIERR